MIPCPVHPSIWLERKADGWRCPSCAEPHYALEPGSQRDPGVRFFIETALEHAFDGFDLKAIAVANHALKHEPRHFGVQVLLATLYRRVGLDADAQRLLDGLLARGRQERVWLEKLELVPALLN